MSYNLVERARKLAKLPAFTRNGVDTDSGRVTQDQFADFTHAVNSLGSELAEESQEKDAKILALLEAKHQLSLKLAQCERGHLGSKLKDRVTKVAKSIELADDQTERFLAAVGDTVG